ncbi:hypothetical protein [Pseudaestuariivita rosea]|uniref:hypothetical protein n=1 Tax=Pseudaestuariivita rosea TaxID=2763263 RepID=UPI001ABA5B5D|nr:hypothetical protein [Pseudaestuariivita rosea]
MKTKSILAAFVVAMGLGTTAAFADCTQADVQAKAMQLNAAIQEMAASDPGKMSEFAAKAQEASQKMSTASDMQEVCDYYDQLLAEAGS